MKHYDFENPEGSSLKNITVPGGTVFPNGTASDPPNSGELFFRTDLGKLYCYVSGSPGEWVDLTTGASGGSSVTDTKNAVINGNFDVWQRGTSQTSSAYGSDDRWINSHNGSSKTHSRQSFALGQTDVPGNPRYFSRTVVTSVVGAGNLVSKYQPIEGVHTFAGETVTLSFYAKVDSPKSIAISMWQSFGSGGTPSAVIYGIGAQQVALTTSWQKYTVTISLPSISGKTLGTNGDDSLGLLFWFDAGSDYNARTASLGHQSGTFDIAQVQLEKGTTATDFEYRTFAEELTLCQRYYEKSYNQDQVPGTVGQPGMEWIYINALNTAQHSAGHSTSYFVTKRKRPTITVYSPATGAVGAIRDFNSVTDITSPVVADINERTFRCHGTKIASTVQINIGWHWTAEAEI